MITKPECENSVFSCTPALAVSVQVGEAPGRSGAAAVLHPERASEGVRRPREGRLLAPRTSDRTARDRPHFAFFFSTRWLYLPFLPFNAVLRRQIRHSRMRRLLRPLPSRPRLCALPLRRTTCKGDFLSAARTWHSDLTTRRSSSRARQRR